MPIIAWRDQMSLDYPPLDDEHKAFLDVINNATMDLSRHELENMPNTFEACYEYVRNHFSAEEDVMERVNFPDIMAHMQAHQQFIKNIAEFRQAYENAETKSKKLDADVVKALPKIIPLMATLSVDRRRDEMFKIITGPRAQTTLKMMKKYHVLTEYLLKIPFSKKQQKVFVEQHMEKILETFGFSGYKKEKRR